PAEKQRETTGTKKDVEKRLKAAETAKTSAPTPDASRALLAAHHFDFAAISPDGTKVAWTEVLKAKDGSDSENAAIYVKNLKSNPPPQRITAGAAGSNHAEGNPTWSPDSKRLAFLSDATKRDQLQLYVVNFGQAMAAIAPKKLTSVKGFLDSPKWSP